MRPERDPLFRLCLAVIAIASWIVPEGRRREWRAEWTAEIHCAWLDRGAEASDSRASRGALVRRSFGAWLDGFSLLFGDLASGLSPAALVTAARSLGQTPLTTGLAAVAFLLVLTASAATLTASYALLTPHRALPAHDRIVSLHGPSQALGVGIYPMSQEEVAAMRNVRDAFEEVGAWRPVRMRSDRGVAMASVMIGRMTPEIFGCLGRRPLLGRWIEPTDTLADSPPVVVLTQRAWRTEFRGERGAIGSTWNLDGTDFRVVGVAPEGVAPPDGEYVSAWVPLMPTTERVQRRDHLVVAKLAAGVTPKDAQDRVDRFLARSGDLRDPAFTQVRVVALVPPWRERVPIALLAAGLLSVGLLVLASRRVIDATGRGRAPGIARFVILAVPTIALAIPLAQFVRDAVRTLLPAAAAKQIGSGSEPVVLVCLLVFSSLLFVRFAPRARRSSLPEAIVGGCLLVFCAIAGNDSWSIVRDGPGFDEHGLVAVHVSCGTGDAPRSAALAAERAAQLPNVSAATVTSVAPLRAGPGGVTLLASDQPERRFEVTYRFVDRNFFDVLGLRVRGERNDASGVVINETLANRLWANDDPIGRSVIVPDVGTFVVRGITTDVVQWSPEADTVPEVFFHWNALATSHTPASNALTVIVRATGEPSEIEAQFRTALAMDAPELGVQGSWGIADAWRRSTAPLRKTLAITLLAALLATTMLLIAVLDGDGRFRAVDKARRRRQPVTLETAP